MNLAVALSMLPLLLVAYIVWRYDRKPEPIRTVFFAFLWGCLSVIPAFWAEYFINFHNIWIDTYIGVAAVEEGCKMAVLMLYIWHRADFDDSFDAIVYSIMVSLGFAAVENVLYLLSGDISLLVARSVFTLPGHITFSILMGFFVAKAKTHYFYSRIKKQYLYLAIAFLLAVVVHGTYDCLVIKCGALGIIWPLIAFVVVEDIGCILMVRYAAHTDHPMIKDDL